MEFIGFLLELVGKYKSETVALTTVVATALAGSRAIRNNTNVSLRSKRADAIMHCNIRYHELYELRMRTKTAIDTNDTIKAYYGRFWGLKSDQFDYWLADLIDIETFCNWSYQTTKSFSASFRDSTYAVEGSFDWGWREIGTLDHVVTNEWFYELTEALREIGAAWSVLEARVDDQPMLRSEDELRLESAARLRERIHEEITDVLDVAFQESRPYRKMLRRGMTLQNYLHTRRENRRLGLLMKDRSSDMQTALAEFPPSLLSRVVRYESSRQSRVTSLLKAHLPYAVRKLISRHGSRVLK